MTTEATPPAGGVASRFVVHRRGGPGTVSPVLCAPGCVLLLDAVRHCAFVVDPCQEHRCLGDTSPYLRDGAPALWQPVTMWRPGTYQRRASWPVGLAILLVASLGVPASATTHRPDSVRLVPAPGTTFEIGGRVYGSTLDITAHEDGLALVEELTLDQYLLGIREVPFSWPEDALAAQAVAARTYLAWTLHRGRTSSGRTYDYDICASQACQVYAGLGAVNGPDGDRWLEAVEATAAEILVYEEAPAQALYSASAGSRTRANQDIWGGGPVPYLQPVDSPEIGVTPYERWVVPMSVEVFIRVFGAGGFAVGGQIRSVVVAGPPEGEGPRWLEVGTEAGITRIPVSTVRAVFNRHGPRLYPGIFPARRSESRRWHQAIMSYSFEVEFDAGEPLVFAAGVRAMLPAADLPHPGSIEIVGEGWGHAIGMSQWGAKAMADQGAGYREILGLYYGGLQPADGTGLIPEKVRVGLAWSRAEFTVTATGLFEVRLDDGSSTLAEPGKWRFTSTAGGVGMPAALGGSSSEPAVRFGRPRPR